MSILSGDTEPEQIEATPPLQELQRMHGMRGD